MRGRLSTKPTVCVPLFAGFVTVKVRVVVSPSTIELGLNAFVNVGFGPIGLEMLRNGWSAEKVVAALVAGDETPEQRQVGVVDAKGRGAAYTGSACVPAAGHLVRDGFTVQGNLLERDEVWRAMAPAYEAALAEKLPFSERLLRALEAAEGQGGDVRGRQSAAIVIVDGELRPTRWRALNMDLRVEDHDQPVPELRPRSGASTRTWRLSCSAASGR